MAADGYCTGTASLTVSALTSTKALGKLLSLLVVLPFPHLKNGDSSSCLPESRAVKHRCGKADVLQRPAVAGKC